MRAIFWGAIVCLVDVTIAFDTSIAGSSGAAAQRTGFKCDVVNDMIGFALIAFALSTIGQMLAPTRVRAGLRFAAAVAALSIVSSLHDQIIYDREPAVQLLELLVSSLQVIALCVFCASMRGLCEAHNLPVARRWQTCFLLCVAIYAVPSLLLNSYAAVTLLSPDGPLKEMKSAWIVIPVLLMVLVPLIYMLWALHQTRRQILTPPSPPDRRRGFEPVMPAG